ncbi:MAG: histidinol dehydrogenase [Kiloniellales bacterium]|nr:histidinol dehydrogenase [Kiloniellales bacterium]
MPHRLDTRDPGFETAFDAFLSALRAPQDDVGEVVSKILARVRDERDAAVIALTEQLDGLSLTPETLRFGAEDIAAATAACDPADLEALSLAAERIRDFHRRQLPENLDYKDSAGLRLGHRWTAVGAAGLYVPGGLAAYPSSVLMNAVPAVVAGVPRIVMTVPTPGGEVNPLVLAAARIAGIEEIYRVGGAQAVGALAYGTAAIPRVDKIVGPGNAYVAEAKRQVFGTVGIDSIAGPSEVLVVADGSSRPDWIAADLLAQAEHDAVAQSILMTDDAAFAGAVEAALLEQLRSLPKANIAGAAWENHGAVILLDSLEEAPPLVDRVAPEHLELAVAEPEALAAGIRNAGAIFLGRFTPEALGDYLAGPNHVLPTDRSARFSSGLSALDFMKRSSIIACDIDGLRRLGPAAVRLAEAEGLRAHARSVAIRLDPEAEG